MRDKIIQYAMKYNGNWNKIAQAIASKEKVNVLQQNQKAITIVDALYPMSLLQLRYPPWCLFYEGDLSLLKKQCITIVGSRQLNTYGCYVTKIASEYLCKKYVIVSGLAKGADTIAHQSAIDYQGKTIGVIASGLATHYPYENELLYQTMFTNHLVLSEYPSHVGIQKHHFVARNRILAALGNACIVTSAKKKSGTMLTVNEAMNLGKDVWCFPYPFMDENGNGCNLLIQNGALVLYEKEQLKAL